MNKKLVTIILSYLLSLSMLVGCSSIKDEEIAQLQEQVNKLEQQVNESDEASTEESKNEKTRCPVCNSNPNEYTYDPETGYCEACQIIQECEDEAADEKCCICGKMFKESQGSYTDDVFACQACIDAVNRGEIASPGEEEGYNELKEQIVYCADCGKPTTVYDSLRIAGVGYFCPECQ